MTHNILKYLFIIVCVSYSFNSYGQGLVTRPTTPDKPNKPKVTINKSNGYVNGHEWVDLGLSVKWATCNVGAGTPSDYGNYYAWGETKPKSSYNWSNCFDCLNSTGDSWGIYKLGGKTQITPTSGHDTARENWGGAWRMPTEAELEELINRCKWTWTTKNGHKGYSVTAPNGNSIFLPAVVMVRAPTAWVTAATIGRVR